MAEDTQARGAGAGDPHRLSEMLAGYWHIQVAAAAAELGLPEHLASGPMDINALAKASGTDTRGLYRLLRALITLGLCEETEAGFALTPAGRPLRADAPGSLRGGVLHAAKQLWPVWSDLAICVKTGGPSPNVLSGPAGFADFANHPEQAHIFNQSMVDSSRRIAAEAAAAYDFSSFSCLMDVGGGYGGLLAGLLAANPKPQGVVFDLAYLANGATHYLQSAGLGARARFVGGDFFKEIPAIADCYVLKFIIHDWNDERARTILANCRAAAGASGRIVLLERIIPEKVSDTPKDRSVIGGDLTMMPYDGLERTESEYRALFADAGLALTAVTPLPSGFSVIEAQAR
jgi:hypothetical protein